MGPETDKIQEPVVPDIPRLDKSEMQDVQKLIRILLLGHLLPMEFLHSTTTISSPTMRTKVTTLGRGVCTMQTASGE